MVKTATFWEWPSTGSGMSYVCASGRWLRLLGLGKLQIAPPTSTERLERQQISAPPSPRVLALPEKNQGWPTETPNQHLNLELNRLYSVDDQLDWNLIDILTDGGRSWGPKTKWIGIY